MSLEENEQPPVILAEASIEGTDSMRTVTYLSPTNGATQLAINISNANNVILTKELDYEDPEGPSDHTYRFSIFLKENNKDYAQINLQVINVNDNPPVIRSLNSSCRIPESCIKDKCDVTCLFKLTDADGELNTETITVYEDGEVSSYFDVLSISHPDTYTWIYQLEVIKPLDYELTTIHSLVLVANDTLFTDTLTYLVYVDNVRQRNPKWVTSPGVFQGEEKTEHTVAFKAIDGDTGLNDEIAYGLNEEEQYFSIDKSTGLLTIHYIDRDILASDYFSFSVLAYKKEFPEYNVSLTMTVMVLDIDDHTPNFTIGADEEKRLEIYIDERSTTLQLNDTITVRDPDLGLNGTFSLTLENDPDNSSAVGWSHNFLIVPTSGYQTVELTLAIRNGTKLDYEDPDWRDMFMQIVATESFDPTHVNHTRVIIHLNDINDEYPVFDKNEYNTTLREDAEVGDFVITCHATDADFNYTDPVTHTLLPLSQKALAIDPVSGNVTVAMENPYNYQQQQEVFLQVLAADSNTPEPHRTYAQLTIHIEDVNNEPPVISLPDDGSQPQVAENATSNTTVVTLTATDPDTGAELFFSIDWDKTYASKLGVALRGDDSKYYEDCFYIDTVSNDASQRNVSGIVRVKERHIFPSKNMDWGKFDTVFLSVKVTDNTTEFKFLQNQNRSTLLTVVILDVNDNPPIFEQEEYSASVAENTDPDTLITSVTATDADGPGNNDVTYSLELVSTSLNKTATEQPEFVKIDKTSGKIYTGDFNIDCEVYQYFIYNVTATDNVFVTVVMMNLTVIDKNDNFPLINNSLPDVHIKELSPNGTDVVLVESHDIDFSVPFHTCYYLIEYTADATGQVRKFFSVDINTGQLIVNLDGGEPLNLVKTKTLSYLIPLMVRDNFADRQTDPTISNSVRSMITVHIDDVNNNAPTFAELPEGQAYLFSCTTHDIQGKNVLDDLKAPDLDEPGPNSWVKYRILNISVISGKQSTAPQDLFSIHNNDDNKTATITIGRNLSNWWGTYSITFYAQDEGEPPLNDTKSYPVRIEGLNDHDPVFTYPDASMKYVKLKREQQKPDSCAIMSDGKCFPYITATDEDEGDNGRVSFEVLGDDNALKYLKMSPDSDDNSATLLMALPFDSESPSVFTLQLEAYDHGQTPRRTETELRILVVSQEAREPVYSDPVMKAQFTENITGMSEFVLLTPPIDPDYNLSMTLYNMSDPIYYYLLNSTWDGMEHFQVDSETGNLTLKYMLDREKIDNYTLYILVSKYSTQPVTIQSQKSVLRVDIKVLDVYDTPPVFPVSIYTGGIKNGDLRGKIVFTVTATDEDLNDTTSFSIENSVASNDQLRSVMSDNPFTVDRYSGVVTLTVDMVYSSIQGFFKFDIRGTDLGNNSNVVPGKIYIVSDANLITFQFNNPITEVQQKKDDVVNVFTKVFGWQCSIDDMSEGKAAAETSSSYTNVRTHFVDLDKDLPIEATQIKIQLNVRSVISTLHNDFLTYSLEFNSFEDTAKSVASGNMEQVLQIVLIVVSVVLGTMVVVLFVAFFYRTRYLTRRLEALSETKFGSKDSGLNRIGMAMPGTNQHAVDGSNPVWRNEEITANNLDTASIGSGDSDLIGIEDNPQFNPHALAGQDRRASFMPGMDERRNSFNHLYSADPTTKQNEDSDSGIHDHNNTNFASNKSIPTTEL
ncbi:cadherin-23-like isoform X2 [Bacillus rossius redtenbacheri]